MTPFFFSSRKTVEDNMKILVVSLINKHSEKYFASVLPSIFGKVGQDGVEKLPDSIDLVTISNELQLKYHLDRLNPTEYEYIFFVITVELYWTDVDYEGYIAALTILEKAYLKECKFCIYFVSFLSRLQLFHAIKDAKKAIFPKSFTHLQLPLDAAYVPQILHSSKADFLYRYCLSDGGIVDKLIHDLRNIHGKDGESQRRFQEIRKRISTMGEFVGARVSSILNERKEANNWYEELPLIIYELEQRVRVFKPESGAKHEEVSSSKPRLLLVEDDHTFRGLVRSRLSHDFEITETSSGQEAIDILAKEGKLFSCLFCDLELLDANWIDQEVQGIDVIDFGKKRYPHLVIKVMTALPRAGVTFLFKSDNLPIDLNDLFYKSNFLVADSDFWVDFSSGLKSRMKKFRGFRKLRGPDNTYWGEKARQSNSTPLKLKLFYYNLKVKNNELFSSMWESITTELKSILSNPSVFQLPKELISPKEISNLPTWMKEDQAKVIGIISKFLIHRLFWIFNLYSESGEASFRFTDYQNFFPDRFTLSKNYATYLGFSMDVLDRARFHFTFGSLFYEETTFLKLNRTAAVEEYHIKFGFLCDTIFDILVEIHTPGASFNKGNYPSLSSFVRSKEGVEIVINGLATEKSTVLQSDSRGAVVGHLELFCEEANDEFVALDANMKRMIGDIIENLC